PEPHPRTSRHPVVEIELPVCVLDLKDEAVARDAAAGCKVQKPALACDIGRDTERDDVRQVAGDVDVAAGDIEGISADRLAVYVGGLGIRLKCVDRIQRHSDAN